MGRLILCKDNAFQGDTDFYRPISSDGFNDLFLLLASNYKCILK